MIIQLSCVHAPAPDMRLPFQRPVAGDKVWCRYCQASVRIAAVTTKPHLRLHYTPAVQGVKMHYPWSVQMVRDPRRHFGQPDVTTRQHWDAAGAIRAARIFWWSDC